LYFIVTLFLLSETGTACVVGQTTDIFNEPALPSALSQDNDDIDDDDDNDDAGDDDNIVDEGDDEADAAAGAASCDDEHVVETTLQSDDMLVTPTQRQHSTTEYLPGMLHTDSPPGLLPKFPSWSILQLGEYSSYNPSTGNCPSYCHNVVMTSSCSILFKHVPVNGKPLTAAKFSM